MAHLIMIIVLFALLFGIFHRLRKPPVRFVNRWSTPSEIADARAANRMRDGLPPTTPCHD
jgi:hypothetical protein